MPKLLYIGNNLKTPKSLPTGIRSLSEVLRKEGFEVTTASGKKNKLLRLSDMLLHVVKFSKNIDFVLIDTYSTSNFWYAYFVAVLCQKLDIKYIPILHGGDLPKRLEISPSMSRIIFKNAHINVTPSLFLLEEFQKAGFFNLKYIPNSIKIEEYNFKGKKIFRPKLLWVRAFAEIYNPLLAIKVLELLLKEFPAAQLCMVGPRKDSSWEKCQQYARQHNLPVNFTGKLKKEEWISLSADADIFINTTTVDNTPISVIEAMALGFPVVSTNVGGLPYLIDHDVDGVLVPPNDPEKMLTAIMKIIKNPEKAQKIAFAARRKVEKFDWKIVKEDWCSIFNVL